MRYEGRQAAFINAGHSFASVPDVKWTASAGLQVALSKQFTSLKPRRREVYTGSRHLLAPSKLQSYSFDKQALTSNLLYLI